MNEHPTPGQPDADDPLVRRLRAAYDPVLDEPVPDRLRAMVQPPQDKVVDIAAGRGRRAPPAWRAGLMGLAMAASVMLGLVMGRWLLPAQDAAPGLTAEVLRALDTQPASAQGEPVRLVTSFVDRSGAYCRSFVLSRDAAGGLACRHQGRWQLVVLARTGTAAEGTFRQAGSALPAAVLQAIDERIAGPALDAAGEAKALQRGWQ